jgi:transcriptional repressor NrdR
MIDLGTRFSVRTLTYCPSKKMKCPYCGSRETEVVETRDSEDLETIRRRRACVKCEKRFTTYERVENVNLVVIKKDGRREQFDRDKLKNGIIRSCEKTTVTVDDIEKIVTEIERELRGGESVEVESKKIGQLVATRLKKLDKIAYIRFSSVFKRFVDIEDFEKEVKKLTS